MYLSIGSIHPIHDVFLLGSPEVVHQSGAKVCFGASFEKGTPRAGQSEPAQPSDSYSAQPIAWETAAASDEWPFRWISCRDPGQSPWSSPSRHIDVSDHWIAKVKDGTWQHTSTSKIIWAPKWQGPCNPQTDWSRMGLLQTPEVQGVNWLNMGVNDQFTCGYDVSIMGWSDPMKSSWFLIIAVNLVAIPPRCLNHVYSQFSAGCSAFPIKHGHVLSPPPLILGKFPPCQPRSAPARATFGYSKGSGDETRTPEGIWKSGEIFIVFPGGNTFWDAYSHKASLVRSTSWYFKLLHLTGWDRRKLGFWPKHGVFSDGDAQRGLKPLESWATIRWSFWTVLDRDCCLAEYC